MNSTVARHPLVSAKDKEGRRRLTLVDQYLREQQELTAVERFAQRHKDAQRPLNERYYRDLVPAGEPGEGQQYAFQVDLDICTGCKACVTACHNLNGLDPAETWRSVGLLHGGTTASPVRQTVTTACHHCLDPACMNGCPVGAYEKDRKTGIVKHLDDQCIGCQYCTLTCPYEVPQYNPRLGIVRKCDMCSDRLATGEAPACVQACPNGAIAITIVEKRQALEDAQVDAFLPGTPSPGITVPTTVYRTERALPRNMLPADFYTVTPSERHAPLVVMLVLTQLSVGAFSVDAIASRFLPRDMLVSLRPIHSLVALALGLVALGASVLHLGRPRYAFRALIGLRTSWMSREILAFGLFATLALLYAASLWQGRIAALAKRAPLSPETAHRLHDLLSALVSTTGLIGVFCSVLIYHATQRTWWSAPRTGFKFGMTSVLLGLATAILTSTSAAATLGDGPIAASLAALVGTLARLLVGATLLKLVWELAFFRHIGDKRYSDLRRTALLLRRDLDTYTFFRFLTAGLGGIAVPALGLVHATNAGAVTPALASFMLLLTGELLERTLFFAAVSTPHMPGGLR